MFVLSLISHGIVLNNAGRTPRTVRPTFSRLASVSRALDSGSAAHARAFAPPGCGRDFLSSLEIRGSGEWRVPYARRCQYRTANGRRAGAVTACSQETWAMDINAWEWDYQSKLNRRWWMVVGRHEAVCTSWRRRSSVRRKQMATTRIPPKSKVMSPMLNSPSHA